MSSREAVDGSSLELGPPVVPRMPSAVRDRIRKALPEASRAPSAHNTQPACWTVDGEGRVVLMEDVGRWLSEGDPTRRDHLLSLGAAWEGMDLALSRQGLGMGVAEGLAERFAQGPEARTSFRTLRPVARAPLVVRESPDPLTDAVLNRRTWRGRFPLAGPALKHAARKVAEAFPRVGWIDDPETVACLAARFDACLVEAVAPPSVLRELRAWMRLSPRAVRSAHDGLTAPTLQLPAGFAPLAGQLLRPAAFAFLRTLGLARLVVSEGSVTRSATGLLVLYRDSQEPLLACGRRLYRVWLTLTASDLAACPMSAFLDVPQGVAALGEFAPGANDRPFAVLRVGPVPSIPIPESPRLPMGALLPNPAEIL